MFIDDVLLTFVNVLSCVLSRKRIEKKRDKNNRRTKMIGQSYQTSFFFIWVSILRKSIFMKEHSKTNKIALQQLQNSKMFVYRHFFLIIIKHTLNFFSTDRPNILLIKCIVRLTALFFRRNVIRGLHCTYLYIKSRILLKILS